MASIAQREADRTRIEHLDARISQSNLDLDTLSAAQHERKLLKKRLAEYTYPVHTLPYEIVAHIFGHFLPVYPLCPPAFGPLAPTTLAQICHRWREIALETPTLWRAISLYIKVNGPAQYRRNGLRCLETWLRLSKSCPLSICLQGMTSNHPENLVPFMVAISSECARWEYLTIGLAMKYRPFQECACGMLRSLRIRANWWDQGWTPVDAPNLRTVVVDVDEFHSGPPPHLPWAQLTTLHLHCIAPPHFMAILHNAVSLVHCKVTILARAGLETNAAQINATPLVLLHLQTLLVKDASISAGAPIGWFSLATFPVLRRLQVPRWLLEPDPAATLLALVSRSGYSLQQLYIPDSCVNLRNACRAALPVCRRW
ncbi:hypothetical protein DFH08DRAFT_876953 [Mycena albidolilacea]|uniref:F-box domain-containing protein n=1 Tax=Mycena albidolilacea TaxID=1033008 RepID=A0AAD6ZSW7_9AGAR|nr:hypothetical protein DFH08DRAFT_876953 [Mycena albidolilacea]